MVGKGVGTVVMVFNYMLYSLFFEGEYKIFIAMEIVKNKFRYIFWMCKLERKKLKTERQKIVCFESIALVWKHECALDGAAGHTVCRVWLQLYTYIFSCLSTPRDHNCVTHLCELILVWGTPGSDWFRKVTSTTDISRGWGSFHLPSRLPEADVKISCKLLVIVRIQDHQREWFSLYVLSSVHFMAIFSTLRCLSWKFHKH